MTYHRIKRLSLFDAVPGTVAVVVSEDELVALELQVDDLKNALRPFVECELTQHVIAGLGEAWFSRWHERARKAMKL